MERIRNIYIRNDNKSGKEKKVEELAMKYQLNDGRIMSEDELKVLYCSMHPAHNKDIEFVFWLYFAVERGAIKVVKGE